MILKFEFLCKFILCISALFFMLRKCYRIKSSKKNIILVLFFGIIVAFASMHIDSILPDITETVKLTALGEKNTAAQSDEIVLYGIRVDNKETKIDSPREGKWFWGTNYMWRNEDDSRQPKGTTRSIVLDISVGWEREIVFLSNPWGGFVQIDCLGQTQVIDTYSDSYSYLNVLLAQSSKKMLVIQALCHIAEFAACWLIIVVLFTILEKNPLKLKAFLFKYKVHLNCGLISCLMLALMVFFSKGETFWNDEVYQVWFSMKNENLLMQLLVSHSSVYPSLSDKILALWYNIAPYGEFWLLLPGEICVAVGVYLLSITCNRIAGHRTAILAAIIGALSSNLIFQCGYEFRGYGFLFLACCITFYVYVWCRKIEKISWIKQLILGIALWLPTTIHIFGVFFCTGFVLTDWIYMVKKRLSIKWFFSYGVSVILYLPWLYNMICCNVIGVEAGWQIIPEPRSIDYLFKYLTNGNSLFYFLLLLGVSILLVNLFLFRRDDARLQYIDICSLIVLGFVISFVFIYGRWINPGASLWVERYFVVLFPIVIYLQALGANMICGFIPNQKAVLAMCLALTINMEIVTMYTLEQHSPSSYQHFKEAADWFYTQQNLIYNDDTLIIYAPDAPAAAWQEYYTTKQGLRDPLEVVSQYTFNNDDIVNKDIVYVYYEHIGMFDTTRQILENSGFREIANDDYLRIRTFERI